MKLLLILSLSMSVAYSAITLLEYNTALPTHPANTALPGTTTLIPSYEEEGFTTFPSSGLPLVGDMTANRPQNGTAYIQVLSGQTFDVYSSSGGLFDALSVDLAEYSTLFATPQTISFTGTLDGGATVNTSFQLDGNLGVTGIADFETFSFPATFTSLTNLRANTGLFSLDNITLQAVPEVSTTVLFTLGSIVILFRRRLSR